MKNGWIWIVAVCLVIVVLVGINYKKTHEAVPLSQIFSEGEKSTPANVEYEFVKGDEQAPADAGKASSTKNQTATTTPASTPTTAAVATKPVAIKTVAPTTSIAKVASSSVPATAPKVTSTTTANLPFAIQVASFKEQDKAQKILDALKKKDFEAYILSRDLKDKGIWYRIYVGKFASKTEASETLAKVKQEYRDSFVVVLPKNN